MDSALVAIHRNGYDKTKPWFDQPKTLARWYKLKPPYDNIVVGCDPGDGMTKADADQFDAIVNVSSTRCSVFEPSRPDQRTYWYPVIEMGRWSHGYLMWLVEVLDTHYERGDKIYLHCHAGAFRSPSAALLWLESRGHTKEEALIIDDDNSGGTYRIQERQGNIPSGKDLLFKMFKEQKAAIKERGYGTLCIESIKTYKMFDPWDHETMSGTYRRMSLLRHYFWFYFEPKWWVKDKLSKFEYWRKGYGHIGHTYYSRKNYWGWMEKAEPHEDSRVCWPWSWNPNTKQWVEMARWDSKQLEYIDLLEKCPTCEGRGQLYDKEKNPPKNYIGPCAACDRNGVKK